MLGIVVLLIGAAIALRGVVSKNRRATRNGLITLGVGVGFMVLLAPTGPAPAAARDLGTLDVAVNHGAFTPMETEAPFWDEFHEVLRDQGASGCELGGERRMWLVDAGQRDDGIGWFMDTVEGAGFSYDLLYNWTLQESALAFGAAEAHAIFGLDRAGRARFYGAWFMTGETMTLTVCESA